MYTLEKEFKPLKIGLKEQSNVTRKNPQRHVGSIVESVIRRKGHNISQLARFMKISRCTIYNWFEQDALPFDVLVRIGSSINYDFSADFPELFSLNPAEKLTQPPLSENEKIDYWIRKYIVLLEKYNECLINQNSTLTSSQN